ncbi:IS3 family transposase, partial [Citrobacter freundii]|uniref:IS3 family transposase n=1 Tax=Citrobacter freundii TaxID=546 RepID=UPI00404332A6
TDDLFVGKTLLHGDVLMWLMKTLLTSGCTNQRGAGQRRKPTAEVLIHSDQGSQYTSERCQHFMASHNLKSSMSRRGNCHDNAVAESFFQLLKRERIKRRIYKNREEAKADIFDYVEMFYNAKRRHSACEDQPPAIYESAWFMRHGTV